MSFWVLADLISMKELFYHTNFKFSYQIMSNFLTIISFSSFLERYIFLYSFDHFSLHFLNYSSQKQAILLFHYKEKLPTKQNKK